MEMLQPHPAKGSANCRGCALLLLQGEGSKGRIRRTDFDRVRLANHSTGFIHIHIIERF